ncbi:MAG: PIN domain-containing protein [Nanoarchaeota archaeon]
MPQRYYLDTSIWLDLFEKRDEPGFAKGKYAQIIVDRCIKKQERVIISDAIVTEMKIVGYDSWHFFELVESLSLNVEFVESSLRMQNRAKDLSKNLNIPKGDVLHALLAGKEEAIIISWDQHFKSLYHICKVLTPREIIDF